MNAAPKASGARQAGVALITVLVVLALATVAAVHMTRQTQLDQHRTSNRLARAQAHQIALGGEEWAISILARVRRSDDYDGVDAHDQAWAQQAPVLPVEGGQVTGAIEDLQGRFNINSLMAADRVNAVALARFERLLEAVEIEPQVAQAVIDWVDADSETTYPGGGEDEHYLAQDPPYLTANRPLTTASELRLVRGIDADNWHRLAPHVTALPQSTPINVNTATPAVLRAIVPDLNAEDAEALKSEARDEPFTSVEQFFDHPLVMSAASGDQQPRTTALAVGSRHFRSRVDVALGPIEYTLYSWLERDDNGSSRVLRRSRTPR